MAADAGNMIRPFKWLIKGGQPGWMPPMAYMKQLEQIGPCCTFDGAVLPHGHRWWICASLSGRVEVRCGQILSDQSTLRTSELPADEIERLSNLIQQAAKQRGRIRQAFVKDGFPANVRLSLPSGLIKFRCNLVVPSNDARVELALELFRVGRSLIDKPSLYGVCTADGQVGLGQA